MSKQALGKGFDGLIPVGFDIGSVVDKGESIREVSIESIVANPDQPRKSFDENSLKELAHSIKQLVMLNSTSTRISSCLTTKPKKN